MFAYYDRDSDIAWFPIGESDDIVSERVPGGLRDYDRSSHKLVAIEVCPRPPGKSRGARNRLGFTAPSSCR